MLPFETWTSTVRRYLPHAAAAALLISGGVLLEGAFAVSPTVDTNRTFTPAPSVQINTFGAAAAYEVPAGKRFTLTDVMMTNPDPDDPNVGRIYASAQGTCPTPEQTQIRINDIFVPIHTTVHLPLVTGIDFPSGRYVCVFSGFEMRWTLRGFLS